MAVNTDTGGGSSGRIGLSQFSSPPCEGAEEITIDLRFDVDAVQIIDLSNIQGAGKWSGVETIYIDNSLNASPIFIETRTVRQTLTVPPNSCFLMPFLVTNPPVFSLTSAGGIIVRMNVMNYFFPPCVWSPTAPPGGSGSGGGITGVVVTDFSAASPVVVAANPLRKWLIISNLQANAALMYVSFAGGAGVEIPIGGAYETGPAVPLGAVTITVAAGNVVVYEGV